MLTSLLSSVSFGAHLIYSPKGPSDVARRSRLLRDAVKYGREDIVRNVAERLADIFPNTELTEIISPKSILIPVPRSSPLVKGALWPARLVCQELVRVGLGNDVNPLLVRSSAIRKAAFSGPGQRPTLSEQFDTMTVVPELVSEKELVIVDDIITKGTTLLAAARRLREAYPKQNVRAFALIRTMGLVPDIDHIEEPVVGTITSYFGEGNREP